MITGAARAEAALLVIDARRAFRRTPGATATCCRCSASGQLAVLVNKMDLVGYGREVFERHRPASAARSSTRSASSRRVRAGRRAAAATTSRSRSADSLVRRAPRCSRRSTPSQRPPPSSAVPDAGAGRLQVHQQGDDRRIVAGTIESGACGRRRGGLLSRRASGRVKSIEAFNRPRRRGGGRMRPSASRSQEQIYVARGELAALPHEPPPAGQHPAAGQPVLAGQGPLVKRRSTCSSSARRA